MDFLARRNHSELELKQKLSRRYDMAEVEKAIEYCREHNWLTWPESLSEQAMNALHRRKKGFLFIRQYLKQKGLPVPERNHEMEVQKARELLQRKVGLQQEFIDANAKMKFRMKVVRILKARGFEDEVIRKVLYANDRS